VEVPQGLKKAIERLKDESKPGADSLAGELLPLLESAADEIKGMRRPAGRGAGEIAYMVERTQQGEVLTERRLSGKSEPFRCPKLVYDALATVLADANRPLSVEEVTTAVGQQLGVRPPDHQIRVALRFWLHFESPIVLRIRARYTPIKGSDFLAAVTRLWQ
jgi:hypothetical protein